MPQGAILSPLLFIVMMSDMPTEEGITIYSYADDVTITMIENDVSKMRRKMQHFMNKLVKWLEDWGMSINEGKTVRQIFSRKHNISTVIRIKHRAISQVKEHRLLGMIFDAPALTWRKHILNLADSCRRRLDVMKTLSAISWGASRKILRMFYIAYIRSKMDYGAILYSGAAKTNLNLLNRVQNSAMRMITGARKTSPILSLEIDTVLPPLNLHREFQMMKTYIKLMFQGPQSSTYNILDMENAWQREKIGPVNSFMGSLKNMRNTYILPMKAETLDANLPPWKDINSFIELVLPISNNEITNNMEFNQYLEENYKEYAAIYRDGSRLQIESSTLCAIYVPKDNLVTSYKLSPQHSVLGAELYAIYKSLEYIKHNIARNAVLFTDSMTSVLLIGNLTNSYNTIVTKIRILLYELNTRRRVKIQWLKAHSGIKGNEIADRAARLGHKNNRSEWYSIEKEEALCDMKIQFAKRWREIWHFNVECTGSGKFLAEIKNEIKLWHHVELKSRQMEVVLARLRIGHAGLASHMYRFNMADTDMCLDCNTPETIEHFFVHCKKYEAQRQLLKDGLQHLKIQEFSLKLILGGSNHNALIKQKIIKLTSQFLTASGRLKDL